MCSIESGLGQKGNLSSEANLYFSNSFLIIIILRITLNENCLIIINNVDDNMNNISIK